MTPDLIRCSATAPRPPKPRWRVSSSGRISSDYARDVMHLVRRLSKRTRLPSRQGILTASMEKMPPGGPGVAQAVPKCPADLRLAAEGGALLQRCRGQTFRLIEALGLANIIRTARPNSPMRMPNRVLFNATIPSRRDPAACQAWEDRYADRILPRLVELQDYTALACAWGMACYVYYLRRVRNWFIAQRHAAAKKAEKHQAETGASRGSQPATRSGFRWETKSNDHQKGRPCTACGW